MSSGDLRGWLFVAMAAGWLLILWLDYTRRANKAEAELAETMRIMVASMRTDNG